MLRKSLFALILSLFALPSAFAQFVPVTGTLIRDLSGNLLTSGQICFAPVNNNGTPVSFKAFTGGQVLPITRCTAVNNGAFSINIADSRTTTPANVCYNAYVTVPGVPRPTQYPVASCLQPSLAIDSNDSAWCNGATCNLDNYPPTLAAGTVAGAPQISIGSVTQLAPGTTPTVNVSGVSPYFHLNLGIPAGLPGGMSVGSVTTCAPGTTPTVTNSGTPGAAVLNFCIPAGAPGTVSANSVTGNWDVSGFATNYNMATLLPRVNITHPQFGTPSGCANTADPTGTNDSTCAINAAYAWSKAHPQGLSYAPVYYPAGTYKTSSEIVVDAYQPSYGDGPNATLIEPTTLNQTVFSIQTGSEVQPDTWTSNGFMADMSIVAPGHTFTGDLVESWAIGFTFFNDRFANSGGRCVQNWGERTLFLSDKFDTCRMPLVTLANEVRFINTNVASAGMTLDGGTTQYSFSATNAVLGARQGNNWTAAQVPASISGSGTDVTIVVQGGNSGSTPNGISPLTYDPTFVIPSAEATISGSTVASVNWLRNGSSTVPVKVYVPGCDNAYISAHRSGNTIDGATVDGGGQCSIASGTIQLWFLRTIDGVHLVTLSGVADLTGLNATWQVNGVWSNCSAVSGGSCVTTSMNDYVISVPSYVSGSPASLTGVKFQPTRLPEPIGAVHLEGAGIQWLGGSIKANWDTGCFDTASVFSLLISSTYCEGFKSNDMAAQGHDLHMNATAPPDFLNTALAGSAAPWTAVLAGEPWWHSWINNPSDGNSAGGTGLMGNGGTLYLYPQDYAKGSTACSAYVTTPLGNCVQKGEREAVAGWNASDGVHIFKRNQSGTTTPTADGNIVWPAGTQITEPDNGNYGIITVESNHLDTDQPTTGTNWAMFCNDTDQFICGSAIIGEYPNSLNIYNATGGVGSTAASFINDEWWGTGTSTNENSGEGFIKATGTGSAVVQGALSGLKGETAEIVNGQWMVNGNPSATAVNYRDGTAAQFGFADPVRGVYLLSPGGTPNSNGNGLRFYQLLMSLNADTALENSSTPSQGFEYANLFCGYAAPDPTTNHSQIKVCYRGGPQTGSGNSFSVWFYNNSTSAWMDAFQCQSQSSGTAASCTTPSTTAFNLAGPLRTPSLTLNAGATSAVASVITASLTPTSVGAGVCSDQTETVTGIVSTDLVFYIKPPSSLGNITMSPTAVSTNSVTLHFCNSTAAAITPPSGTYTFLIAH